MKKKNIIIDGDKFQKEYVRQYKKDLITDLIQGIIFLLISISGLFFNKEIFLKIIIIILPIFILTYSFNAISLAIGCYKTNKKHFFSFITQAIIVTAICIYIILNPIESIEKLISIIGLFIIGNAIIKAIYYPNYLPIGSIILGAILTIFSGILLKIFYGIVLVIMLIYGSSKLTKAIYQIKNKY